MYLDSLNENKTATFVDNIKEELTRRAGEMIQNEDFKRSALDGALSEEIITESDDLSEEVKSSILESLGTSDEVKSVFREAALDEEGDLEIELEEDSSIVISSALARELYEEAVGELEEAKNEKYNKVYRAIAKHFKLDPEKIDSADEKTKKKFYDALDKCWDADKDEVPDSCPINMGMGE